MVARPEDKGSPEPLGGSPKPWIATTYPTHHSTHRVGVERRNGIVSTNTTSSLATGFPYYFDGRRGTER